MSVSSSRLMLNRMLPCCGDCDGRKRDTQQKRQKEEGSAKDALKNSGKEHQTNTENAHVHYASADADEGILQRCSRVRVSATLAKGK